MKTGGVNPRAGSSLAGWGLLRRCSRSAGRRMRSSAHSFRTFSTKIPNDSKSAPSINSPRARSLSKTSAFLSFARKILCSFRHCTHLGCTVKMQRLNQPKRVNAGGREFDEQVEFCLSLPRFEVLRRRQITPRRDHWTISSLKSRRKTDNSSWIRPKSPEQDFRLTV